MDDSFIRVYCCDLLHGHFRLGSCIFTKLINKENREYLIQILNSMPIIYRESIEKFYFQDKSYEEIAKDENVTVKTIASRLYRGKNILKEKWSERI